MAIETIDDGLIEMIAKEDHLVAALQLAKVVHVGHVVLDLDDDLLELPAHKGLAQLGHGAREDDVSI